jgi:coenzyme F420 biosynthesis associated uncharacterized protein
VIPRTGPLARTVEGMARALSSTATAASELVNWELAVSTANRLIRPGPSATAEQIARLVDELRAHAAAAREHVAAFTGMRAPLGPDTPPDAPVLVVDRRAWVRANVEGFRVLVEPLAETLRAKYGNGGLLGSAVGGVGAVGPRVTGVEVGALLAYLSSKVIGQYEMFAAPPPGGPRGRLLLVAPNVLAVERELGLDPGDFRLWVCVHEETHRTQFAAVPWLRDHLLAEIQMLLRETAVEPAALAARLRGAVRLALPGNRHDTPRDTPSDASHAEDPADRVAAPAERDTNRPPASLLDVVQTPAQRAALDRLVAVMSLLEGHADYVMDGVGPGVIPSVAEIRRRFAVRRKRGAGRLDAALRKMLGLDAKLRQYQDGARFVRYVVEDRGMADFNRIWTSPNTLPTRAEIHDPASWVRRVLGERAA